MIKLQESNAGFDQACLQGISFDLALNQITMLLGTNGVGKTCLLHTIAGVLKPLAGKLEGIHSQVNLRAADLSYCYQTPLQKSLIRVGDYLKLIQPLDKARLDLLCDLFTLNDLLEKPIAKLSGGEKQRVKLVSCLAQKATSMILDEPTTALDPYYVDQLIAVLDKLKKEGLSFLIATHDLSFAIQVGDRFLGLKESKIQFDSNRDELRTHHYLNHLFNKKFVWLENKQGSYVLC